MTHAVALPAISPRVGLLRARSWSGWTFVGIENYQRALADPQFWSALSRVASFLVMQVPIMLGASGGTVPFVDRPDLGHAEH